MGIYSRNSFLAALIWAVGVLSACGGGDKSGPSGPNEPEPSAPPSVGEQPDATPPAPATDAPPVEQPDEPCAKCQGNQVCDSTDGVEKCALRPDPCQGVKAIEGHWIRRDDHTRSMDVTCEPKLDSNTCAVSFNGYGSLFDGGTFEGTTLPLVYDEMYEGERYYGEVHLDSDLLTQVSDTPDLPDTTAEFVRGN